jgi:prepilin-type N-terminal cleavage/methylation domain-containing protein
MHATGAVTRKTSGTLDPLAPGEALRIVNRAKERYEAMGRYDPVKADKIAARLFLDLIRPWSGNPIVLGRACGISPVALWKWKTRRTPVHIDTVAKACDRLARQLISPVALAGEAANLMAGIPWTGKKTGSQLLHYAVTHRLSAHCLFHLARRQERLNASDHARSLGVPQGLLARMSAPPECDRQYAMWRGNYQLNTIARRFGLETADDVADFKLMVRHGAAVLRPRQHELAQAFREGAEKEPRSAFLRQFLSLLKERHGLRSNGELAEAVIERIAPSGAPGADDAIQLERRLSNVTKPTHNCVRLLPAWASGMAALAFPGEAEMGLRKALIRYLAASRQPDREGSMSRPSPARKNQIAGETAMGHPMTRERHGAHLSGFTLLELAIVLVIIALVTGMAITSGISVVETARLTATQKKMKAIDDALMQYRASNDRLPCPADLTITQGSANFGLEAGAGAGSAIGTGTGVCTGTGMLPAANFTGAGATNTSQTAAEGAIPAITLGLSPDFMYDGWGNHFRYAVDLSYTAGGAFAGTNIGCVNAAVTVNDANGNARSTGSVYALISHGANGHGAYTRNGVIENAGSVNTNELTNCHCNSSGASTGYAPTYVQMQQTSDPANALDNFDDLVSYKERWQMQTTWDKAGGCVYIYVADTNNYRVEKFSGGSYQLSVGTGYQGAGGTIGTYGNGGNGQFGAQWGPGPLGVVTDSSGNIYVMDTDPATAYNTSIQKFSSSGAYLSTPVNSPYGTGDGATSYIWGMTMDASGNFYIVDSDSNAGENGTGFRIEKFSSSGAYLMTIGGDKGDGTHTCTQCNSTSSCTCYGGSGDGQFYFPGSVAVDASGNIYIADAANSRVQKFSGSGTYLMTIGGDKGDGTHTCTQCNNASSCTCTFGSGNGQFENPSGIAVDASGNIWVLENYIGRVQEFNSKGTWLQTIGGDKGDGTHTCTQCNSISSCSCYNGGLNGQFDNANFMSLDASDNVYVSDTGNNRVQVFNSGGTWLMSIGGPSPYTCEVSPASSPPACAAGLGNGQFNNPNGIVVSGR